MPHIGPTRYALGRSGWAVAGLAALRVVLPLLVLAGVGVPGAPSFEYAGLTGDATGFYAAAREVVSAWGELTPVVVAVFLLWCVLLVHAWRRRVAGEWIVVAVAAGAGVLASIAVALMSPPGAAVVGWPLVWAVPLAPYRLASKALDQDGAYVVAVALSLAANAVTVVASAYCALFATGRRSVAVLASALVTFWPFVTGELTDERGWENGTWAIEVGLAAYTEPLSTALVTLALGLLVARPHAGTRLALAGAVLGLATVVKLANGLLAVLAFTLLLRRLGFSRVASFAASGCAFVPVVGLYWSKGYPAIVEVDEDAWPDHPFALQNAVSAWADSLLFTPLVLLLLIPPAVLGAIVLRRCRWALSLLLVWALVNPLFHSLYWATELHPRMHFGSLPAVFVLWAAGAVAFVSTVARTLYRTSGS
jgi:hypothetical protein